jgi:undecaprenyl-phosphate galactose phosphotransferase
MKVHDMPVSEDPVESYGRSAVLLPSGFPGIAHFHDRHRTAEPAVTSAAKIRLSPAKRLLDLVVASVMVLLLFPLMLVVALAVCADGGPALFVHQRLGRNGRPFKCLKFRTMVLRSDVALRELLATNPAAAREWAETQKLRKDPRVTRIGAFLRATSLDELPQLFNVLLGDMSLVGPRPIVRDEAPRYGADVQYYYAVRPGLTGLWQTSGRSELSYEQRVRLDVAYVTGRSMLKDVKILLKTVRVVLDRAGAV